MNIVEQLTALSLLIDFLFGITFGIVGGAVIGSRRGILLWPASDGLLSAGARVIFKTCTRGYDVHLKGLPAGDGQASGGLRGDNGAQSNGREANR